MENNVRIAKELVRIAKELVAEDKIEIFDFNDEQPQEDVKNASVSRVALRLWDSKGNFALVDDLKNTFMSNLQSIRGNTEKERREESVRKMNEAIDTYRKETLEKLSKYINKLVNPRMYHVESNFNANCSWNFVITMNDNPLKCCRVSFCSGLIKVKEENGKVFVTGLKKHAFVVSVTIPTGKKIMNYSKTFAVGDDTQTDNEWFDTPSECIAFMKSKFFDKDTSTVL